MCGLVGYIGKPVEATREQTLRSLLRHSAERGHDGWGFMSYWPGDGRPGGDKRPLVYKDSVAADKADLDSHLDVLGATAVLMHTRAATSGTKQPIDCHPLVKDHIVVVHNGHIYDQEKMREKLGVPAGSPQVDSYLIPHIISSENSIQDGIRKVFETITGSLTFLVFSPRAPLTIWAVSNVGGNLYQFRLNGMDYLASSREIFGASIASYHETGVKYPAFKVSWPLYGIFELSPYSLKTIMKGEELQKLENKTKVERYRASFSEWEGRGGKVVTMDMRGTGNSLASGPGVSNLSSWEGDLKEEDRLKTQMGMLSRVIRSGEASRKSRKRAMKMYRRAAEKLHRLKGYEATDADGFTRVGDEERQRECCFCAKPAKAIYHETDVCWDHLQSFFA